MDAERCFGSGELRNRWHSAPNGNGRLPVRRSEKTWSASTRSMSRTSASMATDTAATELVVSAIDSVSAPPILCCRHRCCVWAPPLRRGRPVRLRRRIRTSVVLPVPRGPGQSRDARRSSIGCGTPTTVVGGELLRTRGVATPEGSCPVRHVQTVRSNGQ